MQPKVILVVDDERDIATLLVFLLAAEGYRTIYAGNGQVALDKLSETSVDLIMTDVMMPHMDGLELVKAIRSRPGLAAIPILVISALPEAVVRAQCDLYDAFLQKPFRVPGLLGCVSNLLGCQSGTPHL
jgi:CheY-like chemotaxis protein